MTQDVEWLFTESGLTVPAHSVDTDLLLRVLREHYGLTGQLTRLDTEKDATYRFATYGNEGAPAREFLVKVSQPDEPLDIVRCQVDVVRWIEQRDSDIPVQSVVQSLDGARFRNLTDDAGEYCGLLRVHQYIPGTILAADTPTPERLQKVGAMLGRVDTVLGEFSHPGQDRVFVWDLARFLQFEPLIDLESNARRRLLAHAVFAAYREWIAPALSTARMQVIHGDFSPFNVVVDPKLDRYVTGVIDFGDVMRSPVVFDPAVLLGNHLLSAPEHPWMQARDLLDGYREIFPLSDDEVGIVAVASAARVTLRALIANWRLHRGTDRAEYVREHAQFDWGRVENVVSFGFGSAHDFLLHKN